MSVNIGFKQETLTQHLRWKVIKEGTQHQPLTSACVCVLCVRHIYVYTHVNMNACTFHSEIHMQYKDPKQNKINVEGNIFIIEL